MAESLSQQVFRRHVDVALGAMVQWWTWKCWVSERLDLVICKVFSNLKDSDIKGIVSALCTKNLHMDMCETIA